MSAVNDPYIVLSVDLVANPATTGGLFEDSFVEGVIADKISADQQRSDFCTLCCSAMDMIRTAMYDTDAKLPAVTRKVLSVIADWQKELITPPDEAGNSPTQESSEMEYQDVTLAGIKENRPDLVAALQEDLAQGEAARQAAADLKALRAENAALKAESQARVLQEAIESELTAAKLDLADKTACSDAFLGQLRAVPDAAARKVLIEDRAAAVKLRAGNVGPITAGAAAAGAPAATDPVKFRMSLLGA